MKEITKIKFDRIDEGFYQILDQDDCQVGVIDQNPSGRKLWSLDLGHGRVVDGNHDCFSLAIAKGIAKRRLLAAAAEHAVRLCDDDGEGARTVGIYLGVSTNQAHALINAGREARKGRPLWQVLTLEAGKKS